MFEYTHRMSYSKSTRLFACLAISLLVCAASVAASEPDADFASMLTQLDSDDWFEREAATEALIASDDLPMSAIDEALASDSISAEQRMRLDLVSVQRYRRESLAGLGVQFNGERLGAVKITVVVEGFPAATVLQVGDTILASGTDQDAVLIGGEDGLRSQILSRRPGEVLPVIVRRGDDTIALELPLGSYSNLRGAATLDDETVREAMLLRRSRTWDAASEPRTIGAGLDLSVWIRAAFPEGSWDGLVGGGERRDAPVVRGGTAGSLEGRGRQSLLRTFWPDLDEAFEEAGRKLRDQTDRKQSRAIILRSVHVAREITLVRDIESAEANGENTAALLMTLDRLRASLAELDMELQREFERTDAILERVMPADDQGN